MICKKCKYEWENRTDKPKKCPYCQTWINKKGKRTNGKSN